MANRWVQFVKEYASKNNMSYGCAVSKPECKAEYRKKYGDTKKLPQKKERELMGMEDVDVKPKKSVSVKEKKHSLKTMPIDLLKNIASFLGIDDIKHYSMGDTTEEKSKSLRDILKTKLIRDLENHIFMPDEILGKEKGRKLKSKIETQYSTPKDYYILENIRLGFPIYVSAGATGKKQYHLIPKDPSILQKVKEIVIDICKDNFTKKAVDIVAKEDGKRGGLFLTPKQYETYSKKKKTKELIKNEVDAILNASTPKELADILLNKKGIDTYDIYTKTYKLIGRKTGYDDDDYKLEQSGRGLY